MFTQPLGNELLLLERAAHQHKKENLLGHQLWPMPAEIQERLAKEREREVLWERKRQAAIEQDLLRKLVEKIEQEREAELRAKEAAAERASKNRPLSQREIDQKPRRLWLYCKAKCSYLG
jgi:hypothetical protein